MAWERHCTVGGMVRQAGRAPGEPSPERQQPRAQPAGGGVCVRCHLPAYCMAATPSSSSSRHSASPSGMRMPCAARWSCAGRWARVGVGEGGGRAFAFPRRPGAPLPCPAAPKTLPRHASCMSPAHAQARRPSAGLDVEAGAQALAVGRRRGAEVRRGVCELRHHAHLRAGEAGAAVGRRSLRSSMQAARRAPESTGRLSLAPAAAPRWPPAGGAAPGRRWPGWPAGPAWEWENGDEDADDTKNTTLPPSLQQNKKSEGGLFGAGWITRRTGRRRQQHTRHWRGLSTRRWQRTRVSSATLILSIGGCWGHKGEGGAGA